MPLTTDEILQPSETLGIRVDRFEFEILDRDLLPRRNINPIIESASISAGIDRTIGRTLDGLVLDLNDAASIDPLADRLRPWMVLQNGERFPLGVYLFGEHQRSLSTRNDTWTPNCYDQGLILNDKTAKSVSLKAGASIHEAMETILIEVGITQFAFDGQPGTTAEPLAWPAGTERSRILDELASALGCLRPFFDNLGIYRCVDAPDPERAVASFHYGPGRIIADSIIEADDSFSAPNRYIAIGQGSEQPIVGVYDIPATAPHSAANRGYIVSETVDVPGSPSAVAAAGAARAAYLTDSRTWQRVSFSSPLDPRHDLYAIVDYQGIASGVYLETSFRMQLTSGGQHQHELSRLWPVL